MVDVSLLDECDSFEEYAWRKVFEGSIHWPYFTEYRAVRLGEDGMFGIVLDELDRVGRERDHLEEYLHGACEVCGEDDVGSIPRDLRDRYEKPDGEAFYLNSRTVACRECAERVIHDLTTYGEPQPTLTNYA